MASTRQRGRATELKAKRWYEAQGFQVQVAPMPTRWSRQNDLWGLFDLCCVRADTIVFSQVKMAKGSTYGKALDAHRAFVVPGNCRKECLLWEARKREPVVIPL